jgi:hypothetical protein
MAPLFRLSDFMPQYALFMRLFHFKYLNAEACDGLIPHPRSPTNSL